MRGVPELSVASAVGAGPAFQSRIAGAADRTIGTISRYARKGERLLSDVAWEGVRLSPPGPRSK